MSDLKVINPDAEPEMAIDPNELAAANEEAKADRGDVYKLFLRKPFTYEGKTYESLTFNWGKLTGKDSLTIENEMMALGKTLMVPEFSSEYKIRMAVRACEEKVPQDALLALSMADFNKITGKARSFLLQSGS